VSEREREAVAWISQQLAVWFSEDGRAALRVLARCVGEIAEELSEDTREDFLSGVTAPTTNVVRSLQGVKRGMAVGALGGALLFLCKEERREP